MSTSESFRCRLSESNACREDNPLTFGGGCRFQSKQTPLYSPASQNTPKVKLKLPSVADAIEEAIGAEQENASAPVGDVI